MELVRPDWLSRRNRGIHMTIRDVDCANFDVEAMARTFAEWRVTFFSFFAAGYVTTYPTRLALQRISPWLEGRDLTGDLIEAAHRYGIKAIPMIDLGQLPEAAYAAHPEWAALDAQGRPVPAADGALYRACPLGGFIRDYSREMVAEMAERYPLDGVKFGGGSYGFGATVCHCPACQERYPREMGRPLPAAEDWGDPAWQQYHRWKGQRTAETVRHLVEIVRQEAPGAPVVGNAVCFGDPSWTLRSSLDIEGLALIQDISQVEVQSRFRYEPSRDAGAWQYLRWPTETARYMTAVSERPVWTVCSYFMAWPWRRSAVPAAEQTVYLAQMAANGAMPMVNLSGGPPAVHEDPRGFQAIASVYRFMADHATLYEDRSAANLALVYSQETLERYGDQAAEQYVEELRGYELALDEAHIPYDIISCRTLTAEVLARYRALVVPGASVLSDEAAEALRAFVGAGGGLIADYDCGLYTPEGERRADLPLSDLLGVTLLGETLPSVALPSETLLSVSRSAVSQARELLQAYMRRVAAHPIVASSQDIELLPLPGRFMPVASAPGAVVPLRRAAPFRVFPEGWAYTTDADPGEPLAVAYEAGGGRAVYFANQMGRAFKMVHAPALGDLIADAARWILGDALPLRAVAPATLQLSLRRCASGLAVHCVNLTGGERYMREIIPLHGCRIAIRPPVGEGVATARLVSTGAELPIERDGDWLWVTAPQLGAYDVVLFEREALP
jgi:hypothetical protein